MHEEAGLYLGFGDMSPIFYRSDEGAEFWLLAGLLGRPEWKFTNLENFQTLEKHSPNGFSVYAFRIVGRDRFGDEKDKGLSIELDSVGRVSHDSRLVRQNHSQPQPHILAGRERRDQGEMVGRSPARELVISPAAGEAGFEGDFGSNPLSIQSAGRENMGPGACQFVIGSGNEQWI